MIVKAGIAPRPGTWVLERSLDGLLWEPWQFFATHDSDCQRSAFPSPPCPVLPPLP